MRNWTCQLLRDQLNIVLETGSLLQRSCPGPGLQSLTTKMASLPPGVDADPKDYIFTHLTLVHAYLHELGGWRLLEKLVCVLHCFSNASSLGPPGCLEIIHPF